MRDFSADGDVGVEEGHPSAVLLYSYASGALAEPQTTLVETHLSSCSDCLRLIDEPQDDELIQLLRARLPAAEHGQQVGHGTRGIGDGIF